MAIPLHKRPAPATWRERLASFRNISPLLKLIWETSPPLILATIFFRLVRAMLPLAALWVGKLIIDAVVARSPLVWTYVAWEIGLAILGDILGRANGLCDSLLSDRFSNNISFRLIKHAATLDLVSFEDPEFHDKLERARRQTVSGRLAVLATLMNISQDLLSLASLSAGLIVFNPWLMLLLAAAVIPAFLGESHFTALTYTVYFRYTPQRRELDYIRWLGASSDSAKEVKIFGLGDYFAERYKSVAETLSAENKTVAIKRAVLGSLLNVLSTGGYYGAYISILAKTVHGDLTLGTLTFLAGAFSRSRAYIEKILSSVSDMSEQTLYLKDLFDFFEMKPLIASRPHPIPAPRPIKDGFQFENVAFSYPGGSEGIARAVLHNLDLRIAKGEKIALIGANGAGKTTLVKLLARLYEPTEGRILLDGADLRDYAVEDLRREIGVIFQDYMRYDLLVKENIGFGNLDRLTDRSAIETAARKGQASEMIARLPDTYDQVVGRRFEGGVNLSGGEWQKIALARAYMRDAQVLILDEPTATLDARAEYEVFLRFAELTQGRTSVLISHRFSTVRMADRILVLSGGQISEQGSHQELVSAGGLYAELFELQAAGYR
jgi:ATP-binding cassette subfamily B protein